MKRGTPEHAKTAKLARELGIERYAAVGILESLWHMTAIRAPEGEISHIPPDEIAFYIAWERDPSDLIKALISCRWLDQNGDGRLYVHDWLEHADNSVKKYLSRHGKIVQTCPDKAGHVTVAVASAVASAFAKVEDLSPKVIDAWNALGKPFPSIVRVTKKRTSHLKARLADEWWCDHWREALDRMRSSRFCRGENDRGWIAGIDFFLQPDSVAKILEGKYDNRNSSPNEPKADNRRGAPVPNDYRRDVMNADK